MMPAVRMARLLRPWTVGARCVAVRSIFYAVHDLNVAISSVGTVERVDASSVLGIRWDEHADLVAATSPELVDPVEWQS